jgi:hypothetical protein
VVDETLQSTLPDAASLETGQNNNPDGMSRQGRVWARFSTGKWGYELGFLAAVLGAAALALSLAGRRPGWSVGQTPPDPFLVQVYAAHFRHGDLFPVWSSSDAYGMGTPVPLFYQRAFFMVGGVVFILLGGSLKATMVVTLAIFMVIGAYGMRMALSVVTESRLLRAVGPIVFILSNWAFSEWLLRADQAEFAAFMIVPWLLYCCLILVRDQRLSWLVAPVMIALVWAHNTVALASIVVLAVTGVVFLICCGLTGLRSIALRLAVSIGIAGVVLAPGLLAEVRMGKYYDPARTIIYDNKAGDSFTLPHPWSYLFDPSFHWLASGIGVVPFGLNIQLDFGITILLILGLVALTVLWLRKLLHHGPSETPPVSRAAMVVLSVSLAIYLILQLRISLPVWNAFWQLKVVGYPFRMMTFAVPLALILAIAVADWYLRLYRLRRPSGPPWLPFLLGVAWLLSFVLLSPITAHEPAPVSGIFPYAPFIPIGALTSPSHGSFQTSSTSPSFSEYLPIVEGVDGAPLPNSSLVYENLHQNRSEAASLSKVPCHVVETSGSAFESLRITYRVTCAAPTLLALPISYNPFTTIDEVGSDGTATAVAVHHLARDPRIVIHVEVAGPHDYVAHLPTLTGILFGTT